MTDTKISGLPVASNAAGTDLLVILYNAISNTSVANGSPSARTISINNFCANLTLSNSAPSNSSSNGTFGTVRFDSSYLYVCISNNVWRRTPLTSW